MAGNIVFGDKVIRPPRIGTSDGTLSLTLSQRNEVVAPGSTSSAVVNDANVLSSTTATTDTAWDIEASAFHFNKPVSVSLSCSGTGAINGRRLTRVSDGPCVVVARSGQFIRSQTVQMLRSGGQTANTWQSWVAGSLAAAIQEITSVNLPFWSGAIGNSAMGSGFGFAAISPRHVIGVEHVEWMPATLTLGGVTRTLVSHVAIGPGNGVDGYATDLRVGLYDGDFPSFVKVFPSSLMSKLPNLAMRGVPVLVTNQDGFRIQRRTFVVRDGLISFEKINSGDIDIRGGDSGNPAFLVIDGEPVLLGCMQQGGAGAVSSIHDRISLINTAMTNLGGGYQLTQFDLSGFPSYGQ